MWIWLHCIPSWLELHKKTWTVNKLKVNIFLLSEYTEKRFTLKKPYRGRGVIKTSVEAGK